MARNTSAPEGGSNQQSSATHCLTTAPLNEAEKERRKDILAKVAHIPLLSCMKQDVLVK
jgi:hypothetical protein